MPIISLKPFSKFLIIKLSSLGDIIHTLPALETLRRKYPFARIDWLVEERFYDFLKENPLIDKIYLLRFRSPVRKNKWRIFFKTIKLIKAKRYDVAIDFQGLIKSSFFTFLSGAKYRIGFMESDLRERQAKYFYNVVPTQSFEGGHIISKNLSLLSMIDIYENEACSGRIFLQENDEKEIKEELKKRGIEKYYIVHPWAGWKSKQWDTNNYVELIKKVYQEYKIKAIITWAPHEYIIAKEFLNNCGEAALLSFTTSINKMIALIKNSLLVIGGDTGPIHIADALQKPLLALYGPTDPNRTGPINSKAVSIYHKIECSNCKKRTCPYNHKKCLSSISVDEVFENFNKLYNSIESHSLTSP